MEGLQQLSGWEFEALIAELFTRDGYRVVKQGGSGDEGIDLVLLIGGSKDVVQCKRWKNDIGSPVVRDFYGAMMHVGARHGFIITTARCSESAKAFAGGKPITLIDGQRLVAWVKGGPRPREEARPPRSAAEPAFDPYAVLGISRSVTADEIRAAYRSLMMQYHPDKVAHLGPELRELALRKSQEITRAYQTLSSR